MLWRKIRSDRPTPCCSKTDREGRLSHCPAASHLLAPPEDVLEYAARLLGLPVPPPEDWERAEMTPMARSFYSESKRVRNEKIKRELGVTLIHPTYQSGLTALLQDKT